ncbi:similar to Saccharomyces cerevisiae YGR013W SNU71 Component of U1 snRNP required for mRNA splicing via spliceosome [Maudiozyma saulgeensis]|uniref:U1 small nuclear ribonucleoprotein component SNU71 n=1 Tax=Maudiozyma saulgeensis TaxID=1789683 RepID=A0A1X7RAI9_9SACH|nr:similar to Saccharomyces cerevisiae YGR013W SNU71 Component of U1 snRNP required for mRNA splicing via spliceosome [Kazachstania saulgeensis]
MENVVFVCPQKYLISQSDWRSDEEKTGYIPILRTDLQKLQNSLQRIVDKNKVNSINGKTRISKGSVNVGSKDPKTVTSNDKPSEESEKSKNAGKSDSKYQPIKQFLPISLKQQLHTISITGFNSILSKTSIDKFLSQVMELALGHLEDSQSQNFKSNNLIETWCDVFSTGISEQNIFVRFCIDLLIYPQIVFFLCDLFGDILKVHYDSNVETFIQEKFTTSSVPKFCVSSEDRQMLSTLIKEASEEPKSVEGDNGSEISTEYQIDLNTLNDIPRDDLDQLCKDIIEFRTRVVTIEKEKNRQETYNERERQRSHMMKMFDKIKMNNAETGIKRNTAKDNKEEVEEEDVLIPVFENTIENEKLKSERRYEELLTVLNREIEPQLLKKHADLQKAKYYERTLIENESLNRKEIATLGNDELYDNHRSFKELEERDDKKDREMIGDNVNMPVSRTIKTTTTSEDSGAASENPEQESNVINIKFAFKKAIDNSAKSRPEEMEMEENEIDDKEQIDKPKSNLGLADILPFSDEDLSNRLDELRASKYIDELVKEYLGVYEDELVDYIFENILEHRNKKVLLDDLKETFDEDAIVMVDNIWKRKEFTE